MTEGVTRDRGAGGPLWRGDPRQGSGGARAGYTTSLLAC